MSSWSPSSSSSSSFDPAAPAPAGAAHADWDTRRRRLPSASSPRVADSVAADPCSSALPSLLGPWGWAPAGAMFSRCRASRTMSPWRTGPSEVHCPPRWRARTAERLSGLDSRSRATSRKRCPKCVRPAAGSPAGAGCPSPWEAAPEAGRSHCRLQAAPAVQAAGAVAAASRKWRMGLSPR
eukprot:scaffold68212_cov31-Tisochrysis_lutea.AAC.4